MIILHYSLGLPPYRTGGLTKYSHDLMIKEFEHNHTIYLLYPGHYSFYYRRTRIVHNRTSGNIGVFELVNPLPVPLMGGVRQPDRFYKNTSVNVFIHFLIAIKPDIIHIHTLMGLYAEFLEAAKKLGIKTVFTTHDYFGLCPKVNLIDYQGCLCVDFENDQKCSICNIDGYSMLTIYIIQSSIYRYFKDSQLMRIIGDTHKDRRKKQGQRLLSVAGKYSINKNYFKLREYHLNMYKSIDRYHYNSSITREQFVKHLDLNGEIIHITHNGIKDNRIEKNFSRDELHITFLGSLETYKGFGLLKESLDGLIKKGVTNWHLNVYGNDTNDPEIQDHVSYHGRYKEQDLSNIFANTDILVIPSLWQETFGLVGLEALSYGVPVIIAENVGFKDLIVNNVTGFIIRPDASALAELLHFIIDHRVILEQINKNILSSDFCFSMEKHTEMILSFYQNF